MVLRLCAQNDALRDLSESEMLYHKFHIQKLCRHELFDYEIEAFWLIKKIDGTADNNEYFHQLKIKK